MLKEPNRKDAGGGPLEELLRRVPRRAAPADLWERVARDLTPGAVAGRRAARRRRRLVGAVAAAAASVLLAVGLWWSGGPTERAQRPSRPPVAERSSAPAAPARQTTALDEEFQTLGAVHRVSEAGNILPEEMVLVTAGDIDEAW